MTAQGYNSTPGKPYEEVGKPLYLSSRSMLQGSLGQDIVESGKSIRRQTEDKKKDSSNTYEKQAVNVQNLLVFLTIALVAFE